MAVTLMETGHDRCHAVDAPNIVTLVRLGATFVSGQPMSDPQTRVRRIVRWKVARA
jgi:hypothetical protein